MAANAYPTAKPFMPARRTVAALRASVQECRGCPLYANATQAVFGAGPAHAGLMLVGEQPGDQEDRQGLPFVGPAGTVLDRALAEVGIERDDAYLTNTVKHFKWRPRGTRRIHDKPSLTEQRACRPWLDEEIALVAPRAIVLLGATAAQSLLGREFRVTRDRGRLLESDLAEIVMATIHPSAVLRADDREEAFDGLVADLRVAAAAFFRAA
ncbi:MAG TPA: UdgX family uracil-DNA binding protein [Gaiellaceae bacterium]|nr:UdgX family uracil-DNA binding protein [Gaiellaceae bacterium]